MTGPIFYVLGVFAAYMLLGLVAYFFLFAKAFLPLVEIRFYDLSRSVNDAMDEHLRQKMVDSFPTGTPSDAVPTPWYKLWLLWPLKIKLVALGVSWYSTAKAVSIGHYRNGATIADACAQAEPFPYSQL